MQPVFPMPGVEPRVSQVKAEYPNQISYQYASNKETSRKYEFHMTIILQFMRSFWNYIKLIKLQLLVY
jgi:hypothetical protein